MVSNTSGKSQAVFFLKQFLFLTSASFPGASDAPDALPDRLALASSDSQHSLVHLKRICCHVFKVISLFFRDVPIPIPCIIYLTYYSFHLRKSRWRLKIVSMSAYCDQSSTSPRWERVPVSMCDALVC